MSDGNDLLDRKEIKNGGSSHPIWLVMDKLDDLIEELDMVTKRQLEILSLIKEDRAHLPIATDGQSRGFAEPLCKHGVHPSTCDDDKCRR